MRKYRFGLIMSLALLLFFSSLPSGLAETVEVDSPTLNVRSGPGLTYPVVGQLKDRDSLTILETDGDWLKIQFGEEQGWVAKWLTRSAETSEQSKEVVSKVDSLNIRSSPSVQSAVIGKMRAGAIATATGQEGDWISIILDGREGWVSAEYVSEAKESSFAASGEEEEIEQPTVSKEVTDPDEFTVAVEKLNVRKKATLQSKKLTQINKGDTFPVVATDGNWVQVQLDKKKTGWVYSFHGHLSSNQTKVASTDETDQGIVTILTDGTNLREEPSTSSPVVFRVNAGENYPIIDKQDDWYKISLPNGQQAFVAEWVVTTTDSSSPTGQKQTKQARVKGTLKGLTIVVDPGHGGHDRGTTGAHGSIEKDLTLITAELLATKLQKAGAEVVLTRNSDTYVLLGARASIAQYHDADAFVSIHYDAHVDPSISGFTSYYTRSEQQPLAEAINKGLASTITLRDRGTQFGDFHVLRENNRIGVLVELGYLSNYNEERQITTNHFREQATHGIYQGLLDYFN
ncbi:SH3 domain-containing protein [Sporosarcina newyorkensis]|uniref:N-acetylmuramoyl-L-alanine amidase n=1 Tax=Sporosarcina newyorkensis TaxID=759851 RepID=A0A1T4XLS0_9BACL|nr:SH3 domain-containing protein [Sporosarcina newyorkensis]SKA90454.1 N-acetylmuramoyl-L-alanine amidase [Sporosarcina newyorkensis]